MGRQRTTNLNLPNNMYARRRTRKNGKTVIYYVYAQNTGGKRKEISLGNDYHAAIREWSRLEEMPSAAAITFSMAAHRYQQEVIANRAHNTQTTFRSNLKMLLAFFGTPDAPLDSITPTHIRQYLQWRADRPHSANSEINYFSAIFNHARETGRTTAANPVAGIKRNRKSKRKTYIEDRLYKIVYQAADQTIKDLMDVAYLTGQRPVDLVSLHSSQIRDGILHITQQKTGAELRFAVTGRLQTIFERITPPEGGHLFRQKHGRVMTRPRLTQLFWRLRKQIIAQHPELASELNNFQFRDLRAKSATDIYLKSSKTAAKEQLGHTSESMTENYIRLSKVQQPLEDTPE